jgi:hypothetical protein
MPVSFGKVEATALQEQELAAHFPAIPGNPSQALQA